MPEAGSPTRKCFLGCSDDRFGQKNIHIVIKSGLVRRSYSIVKFLPASAGHPDYQSAQQGQTDTARFRHGHDEKHGGLENGIPAGTGSGDAPVAFLDQPKTAAPTGDDGVDALDCDRALLLRADWDGWQSLSCRTALRGRAD